MSRGLRYARLYLRFLALRLQTYAEYRGDALLMASSSLLTDGLGLVFLWVIFRQIPAINGWTSWEVLLIYGLVVLTGGVTQLFFDGIWTIGSCVYQARFDTFLVRPIPPLLSVLTFWMSPEGIGGLALGGALCGVALAHLHRDWSPGALVLGSVLVISGIGVRLGVTLIVNCIGFWSSGPLGGGTGEVSEPMYDLVRYPLRVYAPIVRTVLTTAVPLAFVSVMPAAYLSRGLDWGTIVLLGPAVAAIICAYGLWLFHRGIRRYDSSGN
jgi:ABC-2 type transport system permease protein